MDSLVDYTNVSAFRQRDCLRALTRIIEQHPDIRELTIVPQKISHRTMKSSSDYLLWNIMPALQNSFLHSGDYGLLGGKRNKKA